MTIDASLVIRLFSRCSLATAQTAGTTPTCFPAYKYSEIGQTLNLGAHSNILNVRYLRAYLVRVDTKSTLIKLAASEHLSELIVARDARLDALDDTTLALLTSLLYHLRRARDAEALQFLKDGL